MRPWWGRQRLLASGLSGLNQAVNQHCAGDNFTRRRFPANVGVNIAAGSATPAEQFRWRLLPGVMLAFLQAA